MGLEKKKEKLLWELKTDVTKTKGMCRQRSVITFKAFPPRLVRYNMQMPSSKLESSGQTTDFSVLPFSPLVACSLVRTVAPFHPHLTIAEPQVRPAPKPAVAMV